MAFSFPFLSSSSLHLLFAFTPPSIASSLSSFCSLLFVFLLPLLFFHSILLVTLLLPSTDCTPIAILLMILSPFYWQFYPYSAPTLLSILLPFYWRFYSHSSEELNHKETRIIGSYNYIYHDVWVYQRSHQWYSTSTKGSVSIFWVTKGQRASGHSPPSLAYFLYPHLYYCPSEQWSAGGHQTLAIWTWSQQNTPQILWVFLEENACRGDKRLTLLTS